MMKPKFERPDNGQVAKVILTKAQIKGLASLDAKQAIDALFELERNPHVAMICRVQTEFVMRGTGEPVPDELWKKIREPIKDAWESANKVIEELKDKYGLCEPVDADFDSERCRSCVKNTRHSKNN